MSRYDLELADAQYIVEMYQERAFDSNPAMGVMATFSNNVASLKQVLEIADEAFKISNTGSFSRKATSGDMPDISGAVPCSTDVLEMEKDLDPFEKTKALPVEDPKVKKPRQLTDEEKDRTLAGCIDCGDWPEFDMEWPVFGLDGLKNLLDSINNCLDNIMQQLDPYSFMNGLCPFLDKFAKANCALDLRALIAMLNMLLARYSLSCLKLSINWGVIIGPIIKAIVDFLGSAIELLMRYVSYIFDCMRSFLGVIKNTLSEAEKIIQQTQMLGAQIKNSAKQLANTENYSVTKEAPAADRYSSGRGASQITEEFQNLKDNAARNFQTRNEAGDYEYESFSASLEDRATAKDESYNFNFGGFNNVSKRKKVEGFGDFMKSSIISPNGTTIAYKPKLEDMFDAKEESLKRKETENMVNSGLNKTRNVLNKGYNLIDKIEACLNSAEDYIKELFASFLFSIKSLNSAINSTIELNVKIGGIILLIWDMISLIDALLEIDFDDLCESMEEGQYDIFEAMMNKMYGKKNVNYEKLNNGRLRIDSGVYEMDVIKCGLFDLEATVGGGKIYDGK